MNNYTMAVTVDHTFSPIRVRTYDIDPQNRSSMDVVVPDVKQDGYAPEPGTWGTARVIGTEIDLKLTVVRGRGCWGTVAAGGCDMEWLAGGASYQARIEGGTINGFAVGSRGAMSGTK